MTPGRHYNEQAVNLDLILTLYAALIGLVVGSYFNVLIHRLPRGEPTVVERSRCPHCSAPIRPWHNVPLLGYLMLRGRCRDCQHPIHWRYPTVEALMGVLFVACFRVWHASIPALVAATFCGLLVVLGAIDLEHFILPDRLTLPGIAIGLAAQPWLPWATVGEALVGVVLGAALILAASGTWRVLHGAWGMGLGDAKLLAMVGAFLGWQGVVITLVFGSLMGAIFAVLGMLAGRLGWGSRLPFGAFLAIGAILALFLGAPLLDAYLGLAPGIDRATLGSAPSISSLALP